MREKRDYGRLLAAFGRGTENKPAQGKRADNRLPSLERLLEIDAESELAARQAREGKPLRGFCSDEGQR